VQRVGLAPVPTYEVKEGSSCTDPEVISHFSSDVREREARAEGIGARLASGVRVVVVSFFARVVGAVARMSGNSRGHWDVPAHCNLVERWLRQRRSFAPESNKDGR